MHEDQVRRDPGASTIALVKLVTEIGPDIAEIARRLGQFNESVRYRYKVLCGIITIWSN
jgi:hypothetical protein